MSFKISYEKAMSEKLWNQVSEQVGQTRQWNGCSQHRIQKKSFIWFDQKVYVYFVKVEKTYCIAGELDTKRGADSE